MLIQCDAAQLEWRTILQLAQDEVGIQEVLDKADAHSLNQVAFQLPSRLIAKIYLFRTIFRGSGWSFANDPDFMHVSSNPKYWDAVNGKFFAKYHGIDACHKAWAEEVISTGKIQGPLGRAWSIGMGRDKYGNIKIPWTLLSNYPVQGTGADIMMLARLMSYKRIKKAKIKCKWVSTVHDSIVLDAPESELEEIATIFHNVFADIPNTIYKNFGYVWNVPMTCECKWGMNMKDMEKE